MKRVPVLSLLLFLGGLMAAAAAPPSTAPAGAAIASLSVTGNRAFKDADLIRETGLKVGQPYEDETELVGARFIRAFYERNGYLGADVTTSTEPAPGAVAVHFTVTEGPLYRFGQTRVEGLRSLPDRVIRAVTPYKPGDPYVRSKLFDMQSSLYGRGLFDSVAITASTTSAHVADVVVHVKERQLKWIKGGVGWGSEERERLSLILLHDNLFHRAYHAEVSSLLSAIWKEDALNFVNPYFFDTRTEARALLSWRQEYRTGYTFERTRGETSLGRDLTRHVKGNIALRLDRNIVYEVSPDVAATTPQVSDARSVAVAFNRDTSNDFFFPSRGTRSAVSFERFGDGLGGLINMHRVTLDSNAYRSVGREVVLASALRWGYSQPYGATSDIPVFERFFMGGANSVRGYPERGVGRKDSTDAPLGGRRRFGSSLELRFPLVWKFRGAIFVDGGQVADRWVDVSPARWKYSAGGGVRLLTPVGPLRVDAGYKLNRDPGDTETYRIHFSVGEAF